MTMGLSSFLLRLGLGVVFLGFGIGKFTGDIWAESMRQMVLVQKFPGGADLAILVVGGIEVVIALLLVLGLFARVVAAVAALELVVILVLLRFGEGRDVGLLAGALSLVLTGSTFLSLDAVRSNHEASL